MAVLHNQAVAMTTYETSATVEAQEEALAASRDRIRELFRTVKEFCNSPRIPREELHYRGER